MDPIPHLLMLLLIVVGFSFFGAYPSSASPADDVQALLEFKKGIQDAHALDSWGGVAAASAAACPGGGWRGVACDDAGNVVALALDGLGLAGDLKFSTLTGLRYLRNLTLSGNDFTGRLVPVLGSMASLQRLDLSGNRFYGPIPGRIADLWGLAHLNLSYNNFSQGFPPGIHNLQQLRVLDLRSNGLWGNVRDLLSELRNTEYVDLSSNGFYGDLTIDPQNISSLGNTARYLNFSYNQLNGKFFSADSIAVFKSLETLDLSHNQLSGELPPLNSLYNLKVFKAGSNQLSGFVPEGLLESSMQLAEVDLSGNGFTGSVHTINSTTLRILNLSSNALLGSLPSSIGKCTSIDLSENALHGDLSAILTWEDTLETIDLSSNSLSGSYPNGASQFRNLISFKIRNNSLSGPLPSVFGNYPKLSILDLSLNKFTGPILSTLFTSSTLTILNLSGNSFNGSIPLLSSKSTESLVLPSYIHLESLDLSDNSLSGSLPPEIGNMQRLKLLNLARNELSGEIPSEISKLTELEFLDLSNNQFSGKIPDIGQPGLKAFNVSNNDLSGTVPKSLEIFPSSSFHPGNPLLVLPDGMSAGGDNAGIMKSGTNHHRKNGVRVAFIIGSIGALMLIVFAVIALYMVRSQELCARSGFKCNFSGRDLKIGRFSRPNMFKSQKDSSAPTTAISFSNDHLLTSASRSMSVQKELLAEAVEYSYEDPKGGSDSMIPSMVDSTSPHFVDSQLAEPPNKLDVYSPDRLAGELTFFDESFIFTAEELSRAPAEVLGRSSHGTSYKATLDSGHLLTVKWLRVGLVKNKKEFAKEAKRIGTIRHSNIISWRGFYWGPREQERLIISDFVYGDSLALYLYESTPRRYSRLSVSQRLKIGIDVARCLFYLHNEKGLPHGNLKPTNVLLTGPDLAAKLTDYGLHRLMTPSGTAEQILNLGALGYRAPELASSNKPIPSYKADVYAFGVILMELLTRRSAGDIISGQSGAVDLTDWVQMCNREGRGPDCFDRDIAGLEEAPRVMDELLAVSLRCILPVNERPNIKTVFEDLCSITM